MRPTAPLKRLLMMLESEPPKNRDHPLGVRESGSARPPDAGEDPGHRVVVSHTADAPIELELIERSACARYGAGVSLVPAPHPALAAALGAGDPLVVGMRLAWLPRERDGDRRARSPDVLALTNPRRPSARAPSRIARRGPDRCRLIAGEPAHGSCPVAPGRLRGVKGPTAPQHLRRAHYPGPHADAPASVSIPETSRR